MDRSPAFHFYLHLLGLHPRFIITFTFYFLLHLLFGHNYSWDRLPMAEYRLGKIVDLHRLLRTWWQLITAAGPACTNMLRSCMGYFRKWPKCRTGWKLRIVRCRWCRQVSTFWFWFVRLPVCILLFRPSSSVRFMYVSFRPVSMSHMEMLSWLYIGNMNFRGWGSLLGWSCCQCYSR